MTVATNSVVLLAFGWHDLMYSSTTPLMFSCPLIRDNDLTLWNVCDNDVLSG